MIVTAIVLIQIIMAPSYLKTVYQLMHNKQVPIKITEENAISITC